ncbi:hypothetical protein DPEC_G00238270 [Dallia pectoralis]|uniref:Uncharacterized protein n=1 Tax=Dallia pectoralis TaxID=75939 RepID=A0ACC2FZ51_DALPE|nr:hypothetical protein DPEC_G00238270 [Dallia pectoralis]
MLRVWVPAGMAATLQKQAVFMTGMCICLLRLCPQTRSDDFWSSLFSVCLCFLPIHALSRLPTSPPLSSSVLRCLSSGDVLCCG